MTYDLCSLSSKYGGNDHLVVSDGTKFKISHIGDIWFDTVCNPLKLHNVLYIPAIKKNLLSVAKLIEDNNVLIEFVNSTCVIKDKATGKQLL